MTHIKPLYIRLFLIFLFILSIFLLYEHFHKSIESKSINLWISSNNNSEISLIKDLISKFEQENNCKIQTKIFSDYEFRDFILQNKSSDSVVLPDIIESGQEMLELFETKYSFSPINKDSLKLQNLIVNTQDIEKLKAVPWLAETRVLFFNKDLLFKICKKEPQIKSYSDILNLSDKINKIESKYGIGIVGPDAENLMKQLMIFFWSYGGDLFDAKGKSVLFRNNNITASNMYLELSQVGMIETQRKIESEFIHGNICFCISTYSLIDKIKEQNKNLNYGIMELPAVENKKGTSIMDLSFLGILSKSTKKEIAQRFINFMLNANSAKIINENNYTGNFSTDKKSLLEYKYAQDFKSVFARQMLNSKYITAQIPITQLNKIFESAFLEMLYSNRTPNDAILSANEELLNRIKKYK